MSSAYGAQNAASPQPREPMSADNSVGNGAPQRTEGSLAGKVALITGASGGIGAALATTFLQRGSQVVLSGTRSEKLDALKAKLLKNSALSDSGCPEERIALVPALLGEEGAAENLMQKAKAHMGSVDILVNNAGVTRDGLLMRMKDADWNQVIALNLTAIMQLCRAAIRPMMQARWGSIVNISSVVASMGNPGQCNYVAAKAGLEGFSRSLACEVASRGVRVNCLAPGFIETPMTDVLTPAHKETLMKNIPAGRMGTPEEIARAAAFLASDDASYVTGTTLHVNGGMWRG